MASKTLNTILSLQDKTSSKLVKVSSNFKNLSKEAQKATLSAQKSLNNLGKGIEETVTKAAKLGSGAMFAGLTALGGYSIKVGADFEQSMSKVKALSGATGEDFEKLSNKAKEMGASTSKSASEAADALGYMALAGWNTDQMMSGLEPILRASEAGEMDLATCSDLVTDSMSAMGIKTENLGHYLDVCTKAQASSNTSLQGLLEAYVSCGGTLKNLNVSVEESATVLGTLANRGKKGAQAGNALNSIMVNLTGGSSSAKDAMDSLGISAWDSQGKFIGLKATLVKLKDALANCTDEQKNNFESAIGGKTQLDTLQAMISGVSEEYDDLNGKLSDCNGYMNEAAKTMQDNFKGKVTSLKSAIEGVGISLYEGLQGPAKEVIGKVLKKVQQFQTKLNELKESGALEEIGNKISGALLFAYNAVSNFVNFIIDHKDIIITIASMATAFTLVVKAVRVLTTVLKGFQIVWAILNGTILLSPIGWVIPGITALVGVFTLLWLKCEGFRNIVIGIGQAVITWFQGSIIPIIQNLWTSLQGFWNEVLVPLGQWIMSTFGPIFSGVFNEIGNIVSDIFSGIGDVIEGTLEIFNGIIDFVTGVFTGNWSLAWDRIKEIFAGAFKALEGIAKAPLNAIIRMVNMAIKGINSLKFDVPEWVPGIGGRSISANIPTIPQLATGSHYTKEGLTLVGEHGPELVSMKSGSKVSTNNETKKLLNGNNIPPIQVIIQGNVIGNEQFADYIGNHIWNKVQLAQANM